MCVCLDLNRVEEELGTVLRNAMHSTLYSRSQSRSNRYMQYRVSPFPYPLSPFPPFELWWAGHTFMRVSILHSTVLLFLGLGTGIKATLNMCK